MRRICGDLEADGFLDEATQLWCGVFVDVDTEEVFSFSPLDGEGWEYKMLDFLSESSELTFHNAFGYDFPLLEKLFGWSYSGKKNDTLVASRLMYPDPPLPPHAPAFLHGKPHSIEAWGFRLGRYKPDHTDWSKFSEEMLHRCAEDVQIGLLLYKKLAERAETGNYKANALPMTMKLFEVLAMQEQYGWLIDQEQLQKCLRVIRKWMRWITTAVAPQLPYVMEVEEGRPNKKEKEGLFEGCSFKYVRAPFLKSGLYHGNTIKWIESVGLDPSTRPVVGPFTRVKFRLVSLDKDAEVKAFLLESGWIPDEWNFSKKTGERTSPKLSYQDSFIGVQGRLGQLVAKRVQCKHRLGVLEGLERRIRPDGRIGARVTGIAATGRMTHADIVNIPNAEAFFGKWMRRVFTVPEGRKLVGTDAASCQNRCLAARVNNESFTDTLLNGKKEDSSTIHHLNAQRIKEVAKVSVSYGTAKTLQYGWLFGASDRKLGAVAGGNEALGAKIREALLMNAPGLDEVLANLAQEWRKTAKRRRNKWGKLEPYNGTVTGLDGRPILIKSLHALLVYMLQSDEAIIMAGAYCLTYNRLIKMGYKWGEDFAIVGFMHDEIQIECEESIAKDVARVSEQAIADAGKRFKSACEHKGEADIGRNWYETH